MPMMDKKEFLPLDFLSENKRKRQKEDRERWKPQAPFLGKTFISYKIGDVRVEKGGGKRKGGKGIKKRSEWGEREGENMG